jgi:4-amino-4-deoxy-L-arabinose transferase-like glycosyltransferase
MNATAAWLRRHGAAVSAGLLAAILLLALVLRLDGIAWGLPHSLINVDEYVVVPKAFSVAQGNVNPQFFLYPSFFFYLLAALDLAAAPLLWLTREGSPLATGTFVVDPYPYYLLGRLLSATFGVASVYVVYRIGRVAYGRPTGLLAALALAVLPLHVAYSHMAVTDVTATAIALAALWFVAEAAGGRGRRWLIAGAAAAGLATSTKYNLGMLVLPATVAAVYACREEAASRVADGARAARVWLRLLAARLYGPMLAAFILGSPFVVLDAPHFFSDFIKQNRIQDRGWLGYENVPNGFVYNLTTNLAGTLGFVLLILALAGLAWALWRRTRFDLILAPYVLVYFLYISTWKALADRYLLPILPLLVLLAVRLCVDAVRLPKKGRTAAAVAVAGVLAVALGAPLVSSLEFNGTLAGADTRLTAKAWVEENLPAGSVIAAENYGPPLLRAEDAAYWAGRGEAPPAYRLYSLALPSPTVPEPTHSLAWVRERDVEYVIVSSTVSQRVLAAAPVYPEIVAFYEALEDEAELVKVFTPAAGEGGPEIKVYRLRASESSS